MAVAVAAAEAASTEAVGGGAASGGVGSDRMRGHMSSPHGRTTALSGPCQRPKAAHAHSRHRWHSMAPMRALALARGTATRLGQVGEVRRAAAALASSWASTRAAPLARHSRSTLRWRACRRCWRLMVITGVAAHRCGKRKLGQLLSWSAGDPASKHWSSATKVCLAPCSSWCCGANRSSTRHTHTAAAGRGNDKYTQCYV